MAYFKVRHQDQLYIFLFIKDLVQNFPVRLVFLFADDTSLLKISDKLNE